MLPANVPTPWLAETSFSPRRNPGIPPASLPIPLAAMMKSILEPTSPKAFTTMPESSSSCLNPSSPSTAPGPPSSIACAAASLKACPILPNDSTIVVCESCWSRLRLAINSFGRSADALPTLLSISEGLRNAGGTNGVSPRSVRTSAPSLSIDGTTS